MKVFLPKFFFFEFFFFFFFFVGVNFYISENNIYLVFKATKVLDSFAWWIIVLPPCKETNFAW